MANPSSTLPSEIAGLDQLESLLSEPTQAAIDALARTPGDIILLGVGGKMGPSLARMARRAADAAGTQRRVIGVSRFSDPATRPALEEVGVETIAGDLLDPEFTAGLPEAPYVIFMTGMKFGSSQQEAMTWAMNVYVPALVCQRYRRSHTVAFSTGNVYGIVQPEGGGSVETDPLNPVGEYAMSCVGRERMFQYMSRAYDIPMVLLRLNYASEMRYGVLLDLAQQIAAGEPIDLSMGYVNVIWQADANAMTLCALADACTPPRCVNIAGPEMLSVRQVCLELGRLLDKPVMFAGQEGSGALVSNGRLGHERYGLPRVGADQLLCWIAAWVRQGRPTLGKPTHFQARDGTF